MFRITCTYNKWFSFHKYSLKCMALFFFLVITYDNVLFFFYYFFFSLMNVHWHARLFFLTFTSCSAYNFLKDNETFKSVIKGKQLHSLSSLQIYIILDEFDFGPDWLYFSVPLSVVFYSRENAVDTITPLTRVGIKSQMSLILGQIGVLLQSYMPLSIKTFPID